MLLPADMQENPALRVDAGTQRQTAPEGRASSVYAPPASRHMVSILAIIAVYAIVLAGFFVTITRVLAPPPPSAAALTVVDLRPLVSPPETPPKEKTAPAQKEKRDTRPDLTRPQPMEPSLVPLPAPQRAPPQIPPKPIEPANPDPEAAAPPTTPAPIAPRLTSDAPDTWEGRLLAALNAQRRYPGPAAARRQQGVPYVRFVIDRAGKVLSSRLERSSGFPLLDREAVALPKRAQPLPRPPQDRPGGTLELVVPVEFFLR